MVSYDLFCLPHFVIIKNDNNHYMEDSFMLLLIDLTVRLVNGSSHNEGRVEVFHGGKWGTVCDDDWGIEDANVVCKMLGYPSALRVSRLMEFGEGTGKIILDDVNCLGSEKNIADKNSIRIFDNGSSNNEKKCIIEQKLIPTRRILFK